jgi:hypothetical protein
MAVDELCFKTFDPEQGGAMGLPLPSEGRGLGCGRFSIWRGKRHLMAVDEFCFKTFDPEQDGRRGSLSLRKGEGWGEGLALGI